MASEKEEGFKSLDNIFKTFNNIISGISNTIQMLIELTDSIIKRLDDLGSMIQIMQRSDIRRLAQIEKIQDELNALKKQTKKGDK